MSQYVDICERLCQCVDREHLAYEKHQAASCVDLEDPMLDGRENEWEEEFSKTYSRYLAAKHATREALEAYRTYIS